MISKDGATMRQPEVSIGVRILLALGLIMSSRLAEGEVESGLYPYDTPPASFQTVPLALAAAHQPAYPWSSGPSFPDVRSYGIVPRGGSDIPNAQPNPQGSTFPNVDPGYLPQQGSIPTLNSGSHPQAANPAETLTDSPAFITVGGSAAGAPGGNPSNSAPDSQSSSGPGITLEQVREEARKWAWTKGDFKIVPYGILWFNMAYETQRTVDGDFTLYVYSPDVRDYDAFHVNARATRLGLDLSGPKIPFFRDAASGGKVEIDFFSPVQVSENRGAVMLRHAYWEVKNEYFRLLAGQTWDLQSPLLPGTLIYSVGWGVGNLGFRRAQLRYERYIPVSNLLQFALQGALAVDLADDTPGLNGDHEGWPIIELRTAVTLGERGQGKRPITLGFSGHIGEQFYERNPAVDTDDGKEKTWSFGVDLHMPLTERLGVQGEFFTGANLGHFMGGIVQGINPTTGRAIRSTGGWFELWYDWTKRWHSHIGYGIDDPINRDVHSGGRLYNDFIFANVMYDFTDRFLVGFEYTHWKTHYQARSAGESDHFEFAAKYSF
jgi:hypothetical protein